MQKLLPIILATLFLMFNAGSAEAGVSADFAGCDGLKKPKKKDDGMRGAAEIKGYNSFSLGGGSITPEGRILFCNDAFQSGKLRETQTLRRAHMLRARAAAYLEIGKTQEGLADLDMAETLVMNESENEFFQRSMGTSIKLLRAIAKSSLGEKMEAAVLAEEASAARPYALQVQMASSVIRHKARSIGEQSESPWENLLRLAPGWSSQLIAQEVEIGNFSAAAEIAKEVSVKWPSGSLTAFAILQRRGPASDFAAALMANLHIAYAKAAGNDTVGAIEQLALIDEKLSQLRDRTGSNQRLLDILIGKISNPYKRLIEARIAVSEGRIEDALAGIEGGEIIQNAATLELEHAINAAKPEGPPSEIRGTEGLVEKLENNRKGNIGKLASTVLIAPETKRAVIDYEKSRPDVLGALLGGVFSMGTSLLGGVDRTDGFRSNDNEDGTTTVEYTGKTTSAPLVQEMTLLRAAELAQAANKSHFEIIDRKDFSRYRTVRQYNIEVSRTPIGYKTELKIQFLDSENADDASFETIKVIDDLGPLYYEG